ncbi:hypothetical protein sscle_06g052720 [Sclerotinia sclerotiorum 1980 UF-70]|uniref:PXA domain-containing protein n=1 Tax=Sclerotinia sclerotiorum (strain ATCC 18683 / 1980 / Ss-1) TaxID=665079 RepID=A0A1D9Q6S7_SCLS1|nr:hypothetical protein sscle_06g052720 [Sclerotinia sclerotiorum 1980 UF-70]
MAGVPVRTPFQPRSKAHTIVNTTAISPESTATSNSRPNTPAAPIHRNLSTDAISDRSTLLFIRRTLCSHISEKGRSTPAPIDEILPPLTSSNEVDLQLYAFIAIIIREFVYTWYAKITPDQVFVEEVVKIIAHCTRGLEQRLRKVDLESLLFEELPDLLDTHVKIYRTSHYSLHPDPISVDPRQVYHSLWPFAPLSPVPLEGDPDTIKGQSNNEAAYRQLIINGLLAVLLPTEDLENDCLTSLVSQIFSEMILGNGIGGKACEPWLLWEGIMKIAEVIQARLPKSKAQVRVDRSNSEITRPNLLDIKDGGTKTSDFGKSMQKTFWLVLQYLFLAFATIRVITIAIATSSSLPSRILSMRKPTGLALPNDDSKPPMNSEALPWARAQPLKRPILKMKLWSCVSTLLDMDTRMPWLSATLSLLQWGAITGPGKIGDTDGMIDKLLSYQIHTHILDPTLLAPLLCTVRQTLFPNNTLAPARIPPTPAETIEIRRRCAQAILGLIPISVRDIYFGRAPLHSSDTNIDFEAKTAELSKEERHIREVEDVLNVFSDVYCNKHLLYGIVEIIITRLIPELGEKGVEELLDERLN